MTLPTVSSYPHHVPDVICGGGDVGTFQLPDWQEHQQQTHQLLTDSGRHTADIAAPPCVAGLAAPLQPSGANPRIAAWVTLQVYPIRVPIMVPPGTRTARQYFPCWTTRYASPLAVRCISHDRDRAPTSGLRPHPGLARSFAPTTERGPYVWQLSCRFPEKNVLNQFHAQRVNHYKVPLVDGFQILIWCRDGLRFTHHSKDSPQQGVLCDADRRVTAGTDSTNILEV